MHRCDDVSDPEDWKMTLGETADEFVIAVEIIVSSIVEVVGSKILQSLDVVTR